MTATATDIRIDQVVDVDPSRVRVAANIRHDLGDLTDLTKSVKANGVLVPVLVVPVDGDGDHDYELRYGQRRHAAATAAGRPLRAIVAADVDDAAARIIEQLVENGHRKDLTIAEEVDAYRQLELCGLSATAIAKRAGTTKKRVNDALAVAANDVAAAVVARHNVDLEQAAVIAEFGDDEYAVATLTEAAGASPGRFAHVASGLRRDREDARQRAETIAALADAGITVLDPDQDDSGTALHRLCDGEGAEAIVPEAHAECPGHAAEVSSWDPSKVVYVCVDPEAYGHGFRPGYGPVKAGGPKSDKDKADMRLVRENNKQWRAAESVRREYVQGLLQRRTVPKGTLRYAVTEVLVNPDRVGDGRDDMLAALLGVEATISYGRTVGAAHMTKVSEAQLPLALLAQVAADREQTLDVMTWREDRPATAARWLSFLASTGYTLSDIEQLVVDKGLATDADDHVVAEAVEDQAA